MSAEKGFIAKGGYKFALAVICIGAGFVVTGLGIGVAAWMGEKTQLTPNIADMVGNFTVVLSVSISAFTVTNAGINAMALRKGAPATTKKTLTATEESVEPAPTS